MCGVKSTLSRIGAKIGRTIRQISSQSKKNPMMKTSTITKIRISQPVSMPTAFSNSATRSSPPSARNTNENSVAPKMMKNTSALVSAELSMTSFSIFMLRRLFHHASSSAPAQPVPPASVGVAQPPKMEPSTTKIRNAGGRKLRKSIVSNSDLPCGPDIRCERRRQVRLQRRQDADVDEIDA